MATRPLSHHSVQPVATGRRSQARARVALPAVVETFEGLRHVKVHNLSTAGAMIQAVRPPAVGKELVLKCYGIDALGVVVWGEGDRFGMEFYDPIEEDEVVRQRHLSDDEFARQKWRTRQEILEAAERWASGHTASRS
jgi:hypothetical protein